MRISLAHLALSGVLLSGCRQEQPYRKPRTPVRVETVERYPEEAGARYSGNIEPNSRVDLAFRQGGYVVDIMQVRGADGRLRGLQEGDRVSRGAIAYSAFPRT